MLARAVFHSERVLHSSFQRNSWYIIGERLFSKSRVVLDGSPILPSQPVVELSPYSKLREIAKKSHLPLAHVTKALCTREGKNFILTDKGGIPYYFRDERDVIVPYHIAEPYLSSCKKVCRCKQIDPEYCDEGFPSSNKVADFIMGVRQSVFSVVGEMDHGKTTLLDYLQQSEIQKQEYGGTTQLIRANSMKLHYLDDNGNPATYPCTFLDTPGQSCFADLRENGSVLSDLTLYVISLYEGPTEEAHRILQQLQSNGTPVLFVFTKRDLVTEEQANAVQESMRELASHYTLSIVDSLTISSKSGEGLSQLQQHLVTLGKTYRQPTSLDLPAEASVLDSMLVPSQGLVFRALVQQGVLALRNDFICGLYTGRVRALTDLHHQPLQKALPGMVVHVVGARKLPTMLRKSSQLLPAGNTLFVRNQAEINAIFDQRLLEYQFSSARGETDEETTAEAEMALSLNGKTELIDGEEYVELKKQSIILVGDNSNSINVLLESLLNKPQVVVSRTRVGQILEKDVEECRTTDLKIISFNVELPPKSHLEKGKFVYSRLMSELLTTIDEIFDPVA